MSRSTKLKTLWTNVMLRSPEHDLAALKLANACWLSRALVNGPPEALDLLRQTDAILEFLPFVPEPMHFVMTDRAWCILSTAIQISSPSR